MITYCILDMGGKVAGGIPSRDIALSIATDLMLYDDDHEDALVDWDGHGPSPTWRQDVRVEELEYEEGLGEGTYPLLTSESNHRGIAVHPEPERCDHCGRLPNPRGWY